MAIVRRIVRSRSLDLIQRSLDGSLRSRFGLEISASLGTSLAAVQD